MPIHHRNVCALFVASTLLACSACTADTGGTKLQAQDTPGDHPPSANGTVAELREQLDSDDAVIRSAAAGRLIEMRTVQARQAIEEVLLRGKEPAILDLLKVIGATKDVRLLPMVVQRLRGTTDGIVDATFACLECFDREKVADVVIESLGRPDLGVPETARLAEALGRTRHRKSVEHLVKLLEIKEPVVLGSVNAALFMVTGHSFPDAAAWNAWWTVAQTRTREEWQEEALRETQADPASDVGAELARTKIELLTLRLAQVPVDQPEARLALVQEAMGYELAPAVRAFGAAEAAKLPEAQRAKALTPLLAIAAQDPDPEARSAALEAVGDVAAQAAPQAQMEAAAVLGAAATGGPSSRVRVAGIRGLARLPAELAVERIRPALEDADRTVRAAAVESLGKLPSPKGVAELIRFLPKTNDDPELRKAVVDAMGGSGASEAVPLLVGLLREATAPEARPLRWSIANALAKIRSVEGLDALRQLADDPFLDVRVKAIQGLGASGGQDEAAFLSGVLTEAKRDAKERSAAALALGQIADPASISGLLAALPGDPAVAVDAWKGVLLIVGADRARAVDVGARLVEAQDWARAVEVLDPAAHDAAFEKDSPDQAARARDLLGIALLGAGRRAEALPFLKEGAEKADAPPEAKLRYLQALSELERHAEALALVEAMISQEAAGTAFNWSLRLRRVLLLHAAKQFTKGADAADRLIAEAGVPKDVGDEAARLRDLCREGLEASARVESVPQWKVKELLLRLSSEDASVRAETLAEFAGMGRKAVHALLILAGGTDARLWEPASKVLGALTQIVRPLDASSTEEERTKAVADWRQWYDRK